MDKSNHNELVKYKSTMNQVGFNVLNPREMNIFFAIVSRMRNKGRRKITFNYNYLMSLSNLNFKGRPAQFTNILKHTYQKMLHLTIFYEDKHVYQAWILFTTFKINKDKKQVTVAVNPDLLPVLNNLKRWTRFSLREFTHLKSNYSKTALRLIKSRRVIGNIKFSTARFKQVMDIPKSYNNAHIKQRIITPILVELIPIIKGLGVTKIRGAHNKTLGYKFHWTPESHNHNDFSHGKVNDYRRMIKYVQNNGVVSDSIKNKAIRRITKRHHHTKQQTKRIQFHTTRKEPESAFKRTLKGASVSTLKSLYDMYKHNSPLVNFDSNQARRLKRTIKRKSK